MDAQPTHTKLTASAPFQPIFRLNPGQIIDVPGFHDLLVMDDGAQEREIDQGIKIRLICNLGIGGIESGVKVLLRNPPIPVVLIQIQLRIRRHMESMSKKQDFFELKRGVPPAGCSAVMPDQTIFRLNAMDIAMSNHSSEQSSFHQVQFCFGDFQSSP